MTLYPQTLQPTDVGKSNKEDGDNCVTRGVWPASPSAAHLLLCHGAGPWLTCRGQWGDAQSLFEAQPETWLPLTEGTWAKHPLPSSEQALEVNDFVMNGCSEVQMVYDVPRV